MALQTFTTSTDFAGKGKSLTGYHLAASAAAVVNFRDGGASGTIRFTANVGTAGNESFAIVKPGWLFVNGLYVEVVSGTMVSSAVDLI